MNDHFPSNLIHTSYSTNKELSLFRIVEIHQPLIETYYGPGRMTMVLSLLQVSTQFSGKYSV